MGNKQLSPPIIIGIIVIVVIAIGVFGWHYMSGSRTGPNGVDLSRAAVQPGGGTQYPGGAPNKAP